MDHRECTIKELKEKILGMEQEIAILRETLNNAKLHALQVQINPHFIFNTLNAVQQIAMMENAENTSEFLDKFASLFRYNLKKIDIPVTLKEELSNVEAYTYLLKARYQDWIKVSFNIDQNVNKVMMPAMVFQPLVENAFTHGIGDFEKGGKIEIFVANIDKGVQISIEDNGKGMTRDTINEVYAAEALSNLDAEYSGKTTGIGLKNVIKRLNIFYGRDDIVKIDSCPEKGTRIIITLPV